MVKSVSLLSIFHFFFNIFTSVDFFTAVSNSSLKTFLFLHYFSVGSSTNNQCILSNFLGSPYIPVQYFFPLKLKHGLLLFRVYSLPHVIFFMLLVSLSFHCTLSSSSSNIFLHLFSPVFCITSPCSSIPQDISRAFPTFSSSPSLLFDASVVRNVRIIFCFVSTERINYSWNIHTCTERHPACKSEVNQNENVTKRKKKKVKDCVPRYQSRQLIV